MTNASPGWLPDPTGRHEHRYWDGTNWTDQVADAGAAATDPVTPAAGPADPAASPDTPSPDSSPAPFAPPGASDPGASAPGGGPPPPTPGPPSGPPGGQPPPGLPPHGPAFPPGSASSGPSTGLLVGLGLVVAGLVVAITVVLVSGGDDSGSDTETSQDASSRSDDSTDTTELGDDTDTTDVTDEIDEDAIEQMDEDELAETDPLGMNAMVDQLVVDFGGTIDEDDARCMLREATLAVIDMGRIADDDIANWPEEDQVGLLSAMFSCFDDPETAMTDVLAAGLAENPDWTLAQAECLAGGYIGAAGLDEVYRFLAGLMDETMTELEAQNWFLDWAGSLPQTAQADMIDAEINCTAS